ncbi:MAG: ABC transporter permease [Pseudomonadota bacterium]
MRAVDMIWTMFWLRFTPRNRGETLQLVWVFLEPAGQILVIMMIFAIVGHTAGYGLSFALFLLTGVGTLTMVLRGMGLVSSAIVALRSTKRLAQMGPFADALSAILFKVFTAIGYIALLAWVIGHWQHVEVWPQRPWAVAAALGLAGLLAFGLGLVRGYCHRFAPIVTRTINLCSRALLFLSGTFYVPSFLPPFLREWIAWNPVLHAIELMRYGFYGPGYPNLLLDVRYLALTALGLTAFGVMLVWANRGKLYV